MKRSISFCTILAAALVSATAAAEVPTVLPFQAVITKNDGQPLPDSTQVTFSIWDAMIGGVRHWGPETHTVHPVNGLVFVFLGGGDPPLPIDAGVFSSGDRYLAIEVDGNELSRLRFGATGYTFQAANADQLDSQDATDFAAAIHEHSGLDITSGTIPLACLPVGADSSQVACGNHSHALDDLTDVDPEALPQDGQVLTYRVGRWGPESIRGGSDQDWTVSGVNMYSHPGVTGNVGIGTTSPLYKLDVAGDVRAANELLEGSMTLTQKYVEEGQEDAITSEMISDGAITDGDIAGSAAIAPEKIAGGPGSGLDADKLDGREFSGYSLAELGDVSIDEPAPNQVLKFDGNEWAPGSDETGGTGAATPSTPPMGTQPMCYSSTMTGRSESGRPPRLGSWSSRVRSKRRAISTRAPCP